MAYITSQRHEGWVPVDTHYDDGGFSGGTMKRPALQALLADIEAGRIDRIIVYKVDRLTRSLSDFAKLVDQLDRANASFVSVTQSFNTATSMGRLTLNVLLSFAQFEREVTAERIRDKLAASKAKGLWMGGKVPLGYQKAGRSLTIEPREAQVVRQLFQLYCDLSCVRALETQAKALGLRSKHHVFANGNTSGGTPFKRGQLYYLLRNPIYIGKIRHHTTLHKGQHEAIISTTLWDRVQTRLNANANPGKRRITSTPYLGKVFDARGQRFTPSYASKGGRHYRYYVSAAEHEPRWRLPAGPLETTLQQIMTTHFQSLDVQSLLTSSADAASIKAVSSNLRRLSPTPSLVQRVVLHTTKIALTLSAEALAAALGLEQHLLQVGGLHIERSMTLKARGVETKFVVGDEQPAPDPTLQRTLAKALDWKQQLRKDMGISAIADQEQVNARFIRNRIGMAFLSPKIMAAIADGTQPAHLSTNTFVRADIPLRWPDQERLFGFNSDQSFPVSAPPFP